MSDARIENDQRCSVCLEAFERPSKSLPATWRLILTDPNPNANAPGGEEPVIVNCPLAGTGTGSLFRTNGRGRIHASRTVGRNYRSRDHCCEHHTDGQQNV